RIPNEKIKKNLDTLEIQFDGNLKEHKAYDLVLATNMISVGLDVGRLGVMVMNGMPPNTAEYIQASSRVARKNEGLVITLYDPFNSRDLSYYEDFVQFHKTFYKQVEPLSVTPFAENALDKMLFTLVLAYFRHTTPYTENNMANALINENVKDTLRSNLIALFQNHQFAQNDLRLISEKIDEILRDWKYKIEAQKDLKYYWKDHPKESLIVPIQERKNDDDTLTAMQSMRSVEPSAEILIKQY
ncbi:MAG: helicase-related protein, partial [Rhabdochlamydiaceae bacterium]